MRSKQQKDYLEHYLESIERKLISSNETSNPPLEAWKMAHAFVQGVLLGKTEIGLEAYASLMNSSQDSKLTSEEYWLRFLIEHRIFDVYQEILAPSLDTISKKVLNLNPSKSQSISEYGSHVWGFFKGLGNQIAKIPFDYLHQKRITLYLYLSQMCTDPQKELFINTIIKTIPSDIYRKIHLSTIDYEAIKSKELISALKGTDKSWRSLINYVTDQEYYSHDLFNHILLCHDKLLERCGLQNMLLFLVANKWHGFFPNDIAFLIQLQMIQCGVQKIMQKESEEESLDSVRQMEFN